MRELVENRNNDEIFGWRTSAIQGDAGQLCLVLDDMEMSPASPSS
jgi:hypothetical protein